MKTTNKYVPPGSSKAVNERWRGKFNGSDAANRFDKPDITYNEILKTSVAKALDAGLFYNSEINDFVAKDLGVTDEQRLVDAEKVNGGAFGCDVYMARDQLRSERRCNANTEPEILKITARVETELNVPFDRQPR